MNKLTQFLNVVKNSLMGELKSLGVFFQDRFSFLSETKIWAAIFILAIPVGTFLLPNFDIIVAGLFLAFAFSLTKGSLVGDQIAPLKNLKGLGILDFDMNRVIGHLDFLSVLAYVFGPMWSPEFSVRSEIVGLLGTVGVAIFTASPCDDAIAVEKAESVSTTESEK
jgi:hypothetical protein